MTTPLDTRSARITALVDLDEALMRASSKLCDLGLHDESDRVYFVARKVYARSVELEQAELVARGFPIEEATA